MSEHLQRSKKSLGPELRQNAGASGSGLYTGKGDAGDTYLFDTPKGVRVSKIDPRIEALGALDELNSFLGIVKCKGRTLGPKKGSTLINSIEQIQQDLFIIQAQVAGAQKELKKEKMQWLENIIAEAEKELRPIKTFFLAGGTEISALLDYARTLARRTEREVLRSLGEGGARIPSATLAYMNRLSSLFYALARLENHRAGKKENTPTYK